MIGKKISNYKILGNINNRVVIAHNTNAVEPWVVWWLDRDGDPYYGSYFSNRDTTVKEFINRSFLQEVR